MLQKCNTLYYFLQPAKSLIFGWFLAQKKCILAQKTVDQTGPFCYNIHMMLEKPKRKRRQDTRHAVYCITNTQTGEQYIGITVCGGDVKKALKVRVQKHIRRALTEGKDWNLCKSIREHGTLAHTYGLIEIVRGRKPAHARERELIRMYNPALNSH